MSAAVCDIAFASVAYTDGQTSDGAAWIVRFTRSADVEQYATLEAAQDACADANTCAECGEIHNDADAAS